MGRNLPGATHLGSNWRHIAPRSLSGFVAVLSTVTLGRAAQPGVRHGLEGREQEQPRPPKEGTHSPAAGGHLTGECGPM